eukprot:scaffold15356_cov122-Isochrysis_galbana.AAC.4
MSRSRRGSWICTCEGRWRGRAWGRMRSGRGGGEGKGAAVAPTRPNEEHWTSLTVSEALAMRPYGSGRCSEAGGPGAGEQAAALTFLVTR